MPASASLAAVSKDPVAHPAHRRVEDDGHAGFPDLVQQQVGLGRAVEHEVEAELVLQAQGGRDLGHGVGGDQQRQLAVEDLAQGLLGEVAGRRLRGGLGVAVVV